MSTSTYTFTPDGSVYDEEYVIPEDHSGDFWQYSFTGQELEVLDYYLDTATLEEARNAILIIMHGQAPEQSFQHALSLVLGEYIL